METRNRPESTRSEIPSPEDFELADKCFNLSETAGRIVDRLHHLFMHKRLAEADLAVAMNEVRGKVFLEACKILELGEAAQNWALFRDPEHHDRTRK